jgi:SAM-dependent methyltransferase
MKMDFIRLLRCPYCGDTFNYFHYGIDQFQNDYAMLKCQCDEFPVIADIPILKSGKLGNFGESREDLVNLIKDNRFEEALFSLVITRPLIPNLSPKFLCRISRTIKNDSIDKAIHKIMLPKWKDARAKLFIEISHKPSVKEMLMFYFEGEGVFRKDFFDYFFYRFSQPRHLTVLGFLQAIKKENGPVIELACGFGHMTHEITKWANGSLVIGIDRIFFLLYVAKKLISPEAQYICYDASSDLPFEDNTFCAAVVIDGIHYFDHKPLVIREIKRVMLNKGVLMLICSRNAKLKYSYAGRPMTADGYSKLLGNMHHRIVPDREVVASYLLKQGPDLAHQRPFEMFENEPLISIIASDDESKFYTYPSFTRWPHGEGMLNVNPLFTPVHVSDNNLVLLQRSFPSEFWENDNELCKKYLPEKIFVNKNVLSLSEDAHNEYLDENLIHRFVMLNLPKNYYRFEETDNF